MRVHHPTYAHVIRVVGDHQWDAANGHTVNVADADTLKDLFTQPGQEFVVAADEPLLTQVGLTPAQAQQLAFEGITSQAELAKVRPTQKLAEALGVNVETLTGWTKAAKAEPAPEQSEPAPTAG